MDAVINRAAGCLNVVEGDIAECGHPHTCINIVIRVEVIERHRALTFNGYTGKTQITEKAPPVMVTFCGVVLNIMR